MPAMMFRTVRSLALVALLVSIFLAFQPSALADHLAYEVTSTSQFGVIDLDTGVFTPIGTLSVTLCGLAVYHGNLYGYGPCGTGGKLYEVNPANGSETAIGPASSSYRFLGSTTKGIYGFDSNLNLYSIDPTTGAATLIGATGLSSPTGFGVSTNSATLYITPSSSGCGVGHTLLYSVNTTTATATEIGTTNLPCGSGASVFENNTLYTGGNISPIAVYTLNTTSGTATLVADVSGAGYFYGLAPKVPVLTTTVQDVTTGHNITSGEILTTNDNFQVTVTTHDVDCAGQFVVTALGAPGAPPSVLVQVVPYIIGPASGGGGSVTGSILNAGGNNDWKISTSCNGAQPRQFYSSQFEFFVKIK